MATEPSAAVGGGTAGAGGGTAGAGRGAVVVVGDTGGVRLDMDRNIGEL